MAVKKKLTVKDIPHITVRELAYKIKSVDDYITGTSKGLEAAGQRKPSLTFFLGAGASFESGIMLAGQMMKKFKEKIFEINCHELKTDKEKADWLKKQDWYKNGKEEYGCLFEKAHATKAERQRFIENMIADKEPSFGYVVLADLLLRNYINTVLTTNFDDLVYISSTNFTGNRPIVYAYGILASEMKMTSPHSKVLKLHGDYLYSNIVNTGEEMVKQSQALSESYKDTREVISSLNMERQVRTVFDNFGLVVIGYSGGDKTVMKLLENVSQDNGFYWCYVKGYPPDAEVLELIKNKDGRLVEIEGFDSLMKEISDITDFRIDDLLDSLDQRKEKLKNSITKFDRKYSGESLDKYAEELKEAKDDVKKEKLSAGDYFILGNTAYDVKNFSLAEQYYLKAIELKPDYDNAYNNLGYLLDRDEGREVEAELAYRKAIELNPTDATAYVNLGYLLAKDENRHVEAELAYRKAIALNPNFPNAYRNLGVLLAKDESRWSEAETAYRKAIELNPDYANAYYSLACFQANSRKKENKDEAFRLLKTAIKLDSNYKESAKTDKTLDFIRDDPRFKEIVGD
jgi:tetratricopeptide (TPR) repeat protein